MPQACWTSYAGVRGSSAEPSTVSRARPKSRLCLSTAPAANSPTRSPPESEPLDRTVQGGREQLLVGGPRVRADFRAPVLLPATVTYAADATGFQLRGNGRVHLTGRTGPAAARGGRS